MIVYNATVTHPATVKSRVFTGKRRAHLEVRQGGTLAGTASGEINNMSEAAYAAACGFVTGESMIDREAKEAANTAGWFAESFLMSDATNPAATLILGAGVSGSVNLIKGPTRRRVSFTSSAGTGALNEDVEI
jgi:hypothetical protein